MKLYLSKEITINGKKKYKNLPIIKIKKWFNYYWIKTKIGDNNEYKRI